MNQNTKYSSKITYEKPRRLEEETAQYLLQLDEQFTQQSSLAPSDEKEEMMNILINNVLDEIKTRLASTICDRRTNYLLERICFNSNIQQLMEILNKCQPYGIFLAQNRYGSHVIQAIFSRLCFLFKNNQTEDVDENVLETSILSFIEPMLNSFKFLATEISGSHVLRSILCLLSGLPCISEKKGKGSKHQHAISLSEPLESLLVSSEIGKVTTGLRAIDSRKCFPVPSSFQSLSCSLLSSLLCV
jgi:hypothetical protein